MAYVERLPSGRYRPRYRTGGRGTPWAPSKTYERKDEAQAALDRIMAERAAAEPLAPGELLSMEHLIERWRADRVANKRDPVHIASAAARLKTAVAAAKWSTTLDATPASVTTWRATGASQRTGAMLRALLWWAKDYAGQPVDPQTLVALRPQADFQEEMSEYRTPTEIRAWIAKAKRHGPAAAAMLHCLSVYGWRPITAGRLTVGDVDTKASPWTIRTMVKGRKVVRHPLLPMTMKLLRPLLKGDASSPLFPDPRTGKAFASSGTYAVHQWFRDHIGGKVYDLKYYAINTALEHMSPAEVVQFTGQSINVVEKYVRKNQSAQARALGKLAIAHGMEHRGARRPSRADKRPKPKAKTAVKTA